MKNTRLAFVLLLLTACQNQSSQQVDESELSVSDTITKDAHSINPEIDQSKTIVTGITFLELSTPSVISVFSNQQVLNYHQTRLGENFEVVADDANWYQAMMSERLDSLKIPLFHLSTDTIVVKFEDQELTLLQDSSFGIYTYFYFDGKTLSRTSVMDLLKQ